MKAVEVSIDDGMVVDREGSIWVYSDKRWRYLTDAGLTNWDSRYDLPDYLEPFTRLDANAQSLIRMTPLKAHYCLVSS